MIDMYGRAIHQNQDGSYSTEGITVFSENAESAIKTFNAMAPQGWVFEKNEEVEN